MFLGNLVIAADFCTDIRLIQDVAEIKTLCLPMIDCLFRFQPIHATHHFFNRAETQLRHDFAQMLRNETHEIHNMLGLAGKFFTQPRILRGHTHRTGIQMTDAHQNAAH